ncbi:MAG: tetratricopeptide repeat protein [Muribaculaceae bacterium]|nr:tetratricopeptide repeat protein [Muribaculaceae bacterium]
MRSCVKFLIAGIIFLCCWQPVRSQINAEQVLRVGQNALYFEDYMLSIQYFNQVIAAKPYLAQPYFYRSIAKINLDDFKGAENDATLALERNPFITDAWEVRGVARQNMGNPRGAISDYDEALKLLPNNRSILFNKALAQEEIEDYAGAHETFKILQKYYPQFDGTYLGRARLYILEGDTVNANADLDKALQLNKNATNAYVMRADIAMNSNPPQYEKALADMDEAVKLQPRYAGYFINRAYLRYMLDDYFGAMADYDYAIGLDPLNAIGYFNRGLLRAEVNDNDKAIQDFTRVLQLNSDDVRALYNRAMLYKETKQWDAALNDLNRVIEQYPDFAGVYYARFQINNDRGNLREAEKDYKKAVQLTDLALKEARENAEQQQNTGNSETTTEKSVEEYSEKMVADRFSSLLTMENETNLSGDYNNKSIRGKVQDRNINVEIEPIFLLSYYGAPTQLKESGYYIKEADDINGTRTLRYLLQVTNRIPTIEDEKVAQNHFESIEYYNSYLATHQPRAIDYFGRGMDFMTTRDYNSAISDFTKAINLTADWPLPYFMRAVAKYYSLKSPHNSSENSSANELQLNNVKAELREILADLDKVSELSPSMPFAYYNKGTILLEEGDLTSAISALSKAIELKPDFGEAYYNRGYAYMQLGNRNSGAADLSKAGELGILPSYNLLKRMNQ